MMHRYILALIWPKGFGTRGAGAVQRSNPSIRFENEWPLTTVELWYRNEKDAVSHGVTDSVAAESSIDETQEYLS